MRPDIDLGRQLAAELCARGTTPTAFANKCGIPPRTLRSYTSGQHPIPPETTAKVIVALDDEPFAIPEVRDAQVIRGRDHDPTIPEKHLEPLDLRVDTVVLTLDIDPSRREVVNECLAAHLPDVVPGSMRAGYQGAGRMKLGDESASFIGLWAPWSPTAYSARLQLAPWEPAHCLLLQKILRCATTRTSDDLFDRGPAIRVARLDVAINYPAEPVWLLLNRPRARCYSALESKDGARTFCAGSWTDAEVYFRLYDYARYHSTAGPVARVEAERHFRSQIFPAELDKVASPFKDANLGAMYCPSLSFAEAAILERAREMGLYWTRKHLEREDPDAAKLLKGAIGKAEASPLIEDPKAILDRVWRYIPELLRTQLFWHEHEEGDLQPWSHPPIQTDADWPDPGPENPSPTP